MSSRGKLHLILSGVWALLLIPSFLIWKDALLWVIFMSLYANFVGHISSYEASESAGVDQATSDKLDRILEILERQEKNE